MTCTGLPHSEIPGSKVICTSPRLIAAYHVLHRLLVPRHPPYALCSLTKNHCHYTTRGIASRWLEKEHLSTLTRHNLDYFLLA